VVLEFVPPVGTEAEDAVQEPLPFQSAPGYIQMELGSFDDGDPAEAADGEGPAASEPGGEPATEG
jgi:hypothetical protein